MQILVEIGSAGASPQIGEIKPFCDFFDCPAFFLAYRSNCWADFHASWLKRRVSTHGRSFWELEQLMTLFGGKYAPKTPKGGVNRQFPTKFQKFLNFDIIKTT